MIRGPPASRRVLKPLHPSATPARSTPELFLPERTPGVNELKERLGKGLSGSRVPPESGSIPPAPRGEDLPARSGHGKRRGPAFVSVFLPFPPSPLARSLGGEVCLPSPRDFWGEDGAVPVPEASGPPGRGGSPLPPSRGEGTRISG